MNITEFLEARIAEDEAVAMSDVYDSHRAAFTEPMRARVLAECAAKRAIIHYAVEIHDMITGEWGGGQEVSKEGWQEDNPGTDVVLALAAVYADHPDYREEWA